MSTLMSWLCDVHIFIKSFWLILYLMYAFSLQDVDAPVAREVKSSILRHPWYLKEQLVVLTLFDNAADDALKLPMATALRETPRPAAFPPGKPRFPKRTLQAPDSTLASFIGPNSWLAFSLLGMDGAWLQLPLVEWTRDADYQQMSAILSDLAVVNNAAEQCVRDIQQYANAANDGNQRGNIILFLTSHRVRIPTFLKNEMEENL